MTLDGLHLLLTYTCNFECDHCFVWGSPRQSGTMTLGQIREILRQGAELGTVNWVYFEGGEPFQYYAVLRRAVSLAADHGFRIGMVTNAYWATDVDDAIEWLEGLGRPIEDLSISGDAYHGDDDEQQRRVENAKLAAGRLGVPHGVISVADPEDLEAARVSGQLPHGKSGLIYRGRAAATLAPKQGGSSWDELDECPYEDLREPGRVHVDPFGEVHVCQGISLGNLFRTPLREICERYDPDGHPVVGPLLRGGPAELVRCFGLRHDEHYADGCHLCYRARERLRPRFPEVLTPDAMYGVGLD